jgi:hypothetical protein
VENPPIIATIFLEAKYCPHLSSFVLIENHENSSRYLDSPINGRIYSEG